MLEMLSMLCQMDPTQTQIPINCTKYILLNKQEESARERALCQLTECF